MHTKPLLSHVSHGLIYIDIFPPPLPPPPNLGFVFVILIIDGRIITEYLLVFVHAQLNINRFFSNPACLLSSHIKKS